MRISQPLWNRQISFQNSCRLLLSVTVPNASGTALLKWEEGGSEATHLSATYSCFRTALKWTLAWHGGVTEQRKEGETSGRGCAPLSLSPDDPLAESATGYYDYCCTWTKAKMLLLPNRQSTNGCGYTQYTAVIKLLPSVAELFCGGGHCNSPPS